MVERESKEKRFGKIEVYKERRGEKNEEKIVSNRFLASACFVGTLQRYFGELELMTAGTLLYEATDENGVSRYVYDSGYIYCFKAPFVLKLIVNMEPLSMTDADVKALFEEYLIELGKSIQY